MGKAIMNLLKQRKLVIIFATVLLGAGVSKASRVTPYLYSWFNSKEHRAKKSIINTQQTPIKAICFDLNGVLITTSVPKALWQGIRQAGIMNFLSYLIFDRKNPVNIRHKDKEIIDYMADQEGVTYINGRATTERGHPIPISMEAWQKGYISHKDMSNKVMAAIDKLSFCSGCEKKLTQALAHIVINPYTSIRTKKTIDDMVQLVKEINRQYSTDGQRKFKLIMVSNIDKDLIVLAKRQFPELFNLFDDVIASGEVGLVKPHPAIYQLVLNKHGLAGHECLFVDDLIENTETAHELGFEIFHYQKNTPACKQKMQDLGILSS